MYVTCKSVSIKLKIIAEATSKYQYFSVLFPLLLCYFWHKMVIVRIIMQSKPLYIHCFITIDICYSG